MIVIRDAFRQFLESAPVIEATNMLPTEPAFSFFRSQSLIHLPLHQLIDISLFNHFTASIPDQTSPTAAFPLVPPSSPSVIAIEPALQQVTQQIVASEHGGGDDGHDVQEAVMKEHRSGVEGLKAQEDKTAEHRDGGERYEAQGDDVAENCCANDSQKAQEDQADAPSRMTDHHEAQEHEADRGASDSNKAQEDLLNEIGRGRGDGVQGAERGEASQHSGRGVDNDAFENATHHDSHSQENDGLGHTGQGVKPSSEIGDNPAQDTPDDPEDDHDVRMEDIPDDTEDDPDVHMKDTPDNTADEGSDVPMKDDGEGKKPEPMSKAQLPNRTSVKRTFQATDQSRKTLALKKKRKVVRASVAEEDIEDEEEKEQGRRWVKLEEDIFVSFYFISNQE